MQWLRKFWPYIVAAIAVSPSFIGGGLGWLGNIDTACSISGQKPEDCGSGLVVDFLADPPAWFLVVSFTAGLALVAYGERKRYKQIDVERQRKMLQSLERLKQLEESLRHNLSKMDKRLHDQQTMVRESLEANREGVSTMLSNYVEAFPNIAQDAVQTVIENAAGEFQAIKEQIPNLNYLSSKAFQAELAHSLCEDARQVVQQAADANLILENRIVNLEIELEKLLGEKGDGGAGK